MTKIKVGKNGTVLKYSLVESAAHPYRCNLLNHKPLLER